jgi:DNA end-binding protein Ku
MPPRANWKGYLKLSLVTCSVELFPATSDKEKVSFHLLNVATGHRLKQQYVDSETGRAVDRDNRVKGYEVAKGDYVIVSDEELASIEIESTHTIDIEKFVPRSEVDPVYLDKHYFIAPLLPPTTRLDRRPSGSFAKPCASAASPALPALRCMAASV